MQKVISILIPLILAGCFWKHPILATQLKDLPAIKLKVEQLPPAARYTDEEHELLKSYFGTLESLETTMNHEVDDLEAINLELSKIDLEGFCKDYLIQNARYQELRKPCIRNKFFVCAESMNQYPKILARIRNLLSEENRNRFDQIGVCKGAL